MRYSILSAVKVDGCQVSSRSAACNDFIPTAFMRNMTAGGGTWHAKLDVDGEIVTTGRVARIWEEDGSMTA